MTILRGSSFSGSARRRAESFLEKPTAKFVRFATQKVGRMTDFCCMFLALFKEDSSRRKSAVEVMIYSCGLANIQVCEEIFVGLPGLKLRLI